ncbi:MAG: LysR family transcriptional regulator [Pseudomonadota bacterium]
MLEISDIMLITQIDKAGSIVLAASEMGLTQPALTKRLQAIEERLGFEVFSRLPRGVKLTRLGELLVSQGTNLVVHAQDITDEIQRHKAGESGSMRIGVRPCIESIFFRKSLIAFSSAYPGIYVKVDTRDASDICEAVRIGQLDFAIIALGYQDEAGADPVLHSSLDFEPLFLMPVSILLRKNHPALQKKWCREDLLRYPIACETPPSSLHRHMSKLAQAAGFAFDGPRILVDDYDFILRLVDRTDFWTSVFSENERELSRRDKFAFVRDDKLIPPMTVGICSRKNWTMPAAAETFVELLKNSAEDCLIAKSRRGA